MTNTWVKDNIKIAFPVTYIESNNNDKGEYDMYLMSKCKHFIISNSGFSWWAAWLNNSADKIVIAPDKWFNETGASPNFLRAIEGHETGICIPPEWVKLSV